MFILLLFFLFLQVSFYLALGFGSLPLAPFVTHTDNISIRRGTIFTFLSVKSMLTLSQINMSIVSPFFLLFTHFALKSECSQSERKGKGAPSKVWFNFGVSLHALVLCMNLVKRLIVLLQLVSQVYQGIHLINSPQIL